MVKEYWLKEGHIIHRSASLDEKSHKTRLPELHRSRRSNPDRMQSIGTVWKRSEADATAHLALAEDPGKRFLRFGRNVSGFRSSFGDGSEMDDSEPLKRQFLRYGRSDGGEKRFMRFGKRKRKWTQNDHFRSTSPMTLLEGISQLIHDEQPTQNKH